MRRLEVNLYNGFVFDQGYAPFSWVCGLTYPPNQISIGKCESLGHEILETTFRRKIKGRGSFHCEKEGCILNEYGGDESCAEHQVDYDKIKHIPFEISVYAHGADNGAEIEDINSYLKRFRELTGLKVGVARFRRIGDDCGFKYLLASGKYCRLTGKFIGSRSSAIYRLLPMWFIDGYNDNENSSDSYLFPTEIPIDPKAFRSFITEGLERGLITKEDVKLRKKILSWQIVFNKALCRMVRDDEVAISDDSGKRIDKEEAMNIGKGVIDGYSNTLGLLEEILSNPIPPLQIS